jgi:hypothetical protein
MKAKELIFALWGRATENVGKQLKTRGLSFALGEREFGVEEDRAGARIMQDADRGWIKREHEQV